MNVFPRLYLAWTSFAKPNQEWGKLQCLYSLLCTSFSLKRVKFQFLCCATLVSWLSRFLTSTSVSASTSLHTKLKYSMEVCHFGFFCWPKGFIFFLVSGVPIKTHKDILKNNPPHILVGTPGRILGLTRSKDLKLDKIKHFVIDECDRVLEAVGNLCAVFLLNLSHFSKIFCRHAKGCAGNLPCHAS